MRSSWAQFFYFCCFNVIVYVSLFFISSLLCGELLFIVLNGHGGKIIVRTYMGSMRHKYIVVYMILLLNYSKNS